MQYCGVKSKTKAFTMQINWRTQVQSVLLPKLNDAGYDISSLRDNKCVQNFGSHTTYRMVTWQIQAMEGLHERGCKGTLL